MLFWIIILLFLCTFSAFLSSFFLSRFWCRLITVCVCAPNQIIFWQMVIRPHFILFIYFYFSVCFFIVMMIFSPCFLEPPVTTTSTTLHLFILLAQLFDSLIRSNFKWHIIFDAVHGGVHLVRNHLFNGGINVTVYNHHFTLSLSLSFFQLTHTAKRIVSYLVMVTFIWF